MSKDRSERHSVGKVGLLVVNYRTHEDVAGLLASVEVVSMDQAVTAVIVDNSEDPTEWAALVEVVRVAHRPGLEVCAVRADCNRGYAGGNNLAFSRLGPDVDTVAVINPDSRFRRGSLAALREEVLRHDRFVHGARYDAVDDWETGVVAIDKITGRPVGVDANKPLRETGRKIPYIAGHFIAMSRATWERLGGLSEDYFLFAEEADLALRNGCHYSRVADSIEVSHSRESSMEQSANVGRSPARLFHSARSGVILFRKFPHLRRRLPLVVVARLAFGVVTAVQTRPAAGLIVARGVLAGLRHQLGSPGYLNPTSAPQRTPVVHVTWQRHGGRAEEIARSLDGHEVHVHPGGMTRRALVPVRYVVSVLMTVGALVRSRPQAVIVTNPPVFPGLIVAAWAKVTKKPFVLDSHPGSFGAKGNTVARRFLSWTRWLVRHATAVMVTVPEYVRLVESWGGRGIIVHEAPPVWVLPETVATGVRPRVLYVCVFSDDEPVEEVLEAARLLPGIDVAVTGDRAKCPVSVRDSAPANVKFVGFLGPQSYADQVASASVVMSLTTDSTSVMRSAYEAVYARRALVVSDWPALREAFPLANHSANSAEALADAVRAALQQDPEELRAAHSIQLARWEEQLATLRSAITENAASDNTSE